MQAGTGSLQATLFVPEGGFSLQKTWHLSRHTFYKQR